MKKIANYLIFKVLLLLQTAIVPSISFHSFESDFSENPYYAVNPLQTAQLAKLEHQLVTKLANLDYNTFVQTDICGEALLNYINEYTQDAIQVVFSKREEYQDFSQTFSENPILAFKLIRRIYITLVEDTLNSACKDIEYITKTITETFHQANVRPPMDQDYEDALLGLLRIQYIYGFDASQVRKPNKIF